MSTLRSSDGSEDMIDRRPHETAVLRFLQNGSRSAELTRHACRAAVNFFDTEEAYRVLYGKLVKEHDKKGLPRPNPHPPEERSDRGRDEMVARTLSQMETRGLITAEFEGKKRVSYHLSPNGRSYLDHPEKHRKTIMRPMHSGNKDRWKGDFPEAETFLCFLCDEPIDPHQPGTKFFLQGWGTRREAGAGGTNSITHIHEMGKYAHGPCLEGK